MMGPTTEFCRRCATPIEKKGYCQRCERVRRAEQVDERGVSVVLEYPIPEAMAEFNLAWAGPGLFAVLTDLREWLRRQRKYEDLHEIPIRNVEARIWDLMVEHGVTHLEGM